MSSTSRLCWFHRGRLWRQSRFHGLQIVQKIVDIPWNPARTSESLGTAPIHQVAQAEIVEMTEIGAFLPSESAPPMFVTAPALEAPPVVVEQVQPAPVMEYVTLAPVLM